MRPRWAPSASQITVQQKIRATKGQRLGVLKADIAPNSNTQKAPSHGDMSKTVSSSPSGPPANTAGTSTSIKSSNMTTADDSSLLIKVKAKSVSHTPWSKEIQIPTKRKALHLSHVRAKVY